MQSGTAPRPPASTPQPGSESPLESPRVPSARLSGPHPHTPLCYVGPLRPTVPQAGPGEAGAAGRARAGGTAGDVLCWHLTDACFSGAKEPPLPAQTPAALPPRPCPLSHRKQAEFGFLHSPLPKTQPRLCPLGHPVTIRSQALGTGPFVTRVRTLAEGRDSQPARGTESRWQGRERQVWGTGGQDIGALVGAAAKQDPCGQEDSGARSKVVTSLELGWAWRQGALPLGWPALGVPAWSPVRRDTVLTVGREQSACCRTRSVVPTSGSGWDSGGLGWGGLAGGDSCC